MNSSDQAKVIHYSQLFAAIYETGTLTTDRCVYGIMPKQVHLKLKCQKES